jgi:hypothetical protein
MEFGPKKKCLTVAKRDKLEIAPSVWAGIGLVQIRRAADFKFGGREFEFLQGRRFVVAIAIAWRGFVDSRSSLLAGGAISIRLLAERTPCPLRCLSKQGGTRCPAKTVHQTRKSAR